MEQEASAYITSVHLKGYKSIRDVSVTLNKGLNILIGANGSGKTNFLEFLDAAFMGGYDILFNEQTRKYECEISMQKPSFDIKIKGERLIKLSARSASYQVDKVFEKNKKTKVTTSYFLNEDKKIIREETDDVNDVSSDFDYYTTYLRFENPLVTILKDKLSLLLSIINHKTKHYVFSEMKANEISSFLKILFYREKEVSTSPNINDLISEINGGNWIIFDNLLQNLKQFSPIKDIKIDWELTRQTLNVSYDSMQSALIEGIDFQFFVNNEWINWTQLSDGTKRLFYLIGSVTYSTENEIILIEEPELGVHPHQLALLMNFLKSESEDKQIVISTHSPQVLNCLKGEELDRIIVARHEGKAGTKLYHLSDEEKGYASEYMEKESFLSDYWMLSGFMNEEMPESV
jgi:predicted ATP-dependent endonuclease of OLD family